jgi:hypothetical protein
MFFCVWVFGVFVCGYLAILFAGICRFCVWVFGACIFVCGYLVLVCGYLAASARCLALSLSLARSLLCMFLSPPPPPPPLSRVHARALSPYKHTLSLLRARSLSPR